MNFKDALKAASLNQKDIAASIGVSRSLIAKWVSGELTPGQSYVQKIHEILGREDITFDHPIKPAYVCFDDDKIIALVATDPSLTRSYPYVRKIYLNKPISEFCESYY